MSRQTSWQCLSLQEFFSLSNWQGQPQKRHNWQHQNQLLNLNKQAQATLARRQASWQCLSVQEFFSLSNWQGQLQRHNWQHTKPSSLLTQVREFFEFIPWEGSPAIGSLPKVSSFIEPISTGACHLFRENKPFR